MYTAAEKSGFKYRFHIPAEEGEEGARSAAFNVSVEKGSVDLISSTFFLSFCSLR